MARLIDLDVIAPAPDTTVRIGAVDYQLPGDIPVERYCALVDAAGQLERADGEDALAAGRHAAALLLELFQIRQPDLAELPVGPRRLVPLIFLLFNDSEDPDPRAEQDPPPRAEEAASTKKRSGGSAKSSAKTRTKRTRSRSSTSSAS